MKKVYAISDIHGHKLTFDKLLHKIQFEKKDKLFVLGDLIDRGPDSKGVFDSIIQLKKNGFDINCLLGNHEQLLLNAYANPADEQIWLRNGGGQTLQSFSCNMSKDIDQKYIQFIHTFKPYYEWDRFLFVHAGINMTLEYPLEDLNSLLWLRDPSNYYYDRDWLGDRTVIHGHTPIDKERLADQIYMRNRIINIDNGCFRKDFGFSSLCALRLNDMELFFQARVEE